MTEKQFTCIDESIINIQTDELVNASSEESAEVLVGWLNKQYETIQKLLEIEDERWVKCSEKDKETIDKLNKRIALLKKGLLDLMFISEDKINIQKYEEHYNLNYSKYKEWLHSVDGHLTI